jgi:hypothetical protein
MWTDFHLSSCTRCHIRIVRSSEPDTSVSPFLEKVKAVTDSVWPVRNCCIRALWKGVLPAPIPLGSHTKCNSLPAVSHICMVFSDVPRIPVVASTRDPLLLVAAIQNGSVCMSATFAVIELVRVLKMKRPPLGPAKSTATCSSSST